MMPSAPASEPQHTAPSTQRIASPLFPTVETAEGHLRGFCAADVTVFRGVHYAESTAGAARFLAPRPLVAWTGVRDALSYSEVSPQIPADRRSPYADLISVDHQPAGIGEDCLSMNVWTPYVGTDDPRPVIVVLHGGGFYGGSANAIGMNGERMARFSGSVVVSVNHRLGAAGFLHLAEHMGPDYADSGAVGMMDIVEALRWIQRNIAQFGGDPSRVLVYGQSGGGAKTSTLLGMPSASGLFHRAGVMSGSALRLTPPERAAERTDQLLKLLQISPGDERALQELSLLDLVAAQGTLEAEARQRGEAPGSFAPVMGTPSIPHHPFDPAAPVESADIPLIVSTALDERAYRLLNFGMDDAELLTFVRERAGDGAGEVISAYRDEDPTAPPSLLAARIDSDLTFRPAAFEMAERKATQGRAPVWTYLWTWPSPAYGGRFGAVHGIDVGPSLYSVRGGLNGPSESSIAMATRIASSWAAFAATGDPANEHLPEWPSYTTQRRTTMIFDEHLRTEDDPRAHVRDLWSSRGVQARGMSWTGR